MHGLSQNSRFVIDLTSGMYFSTRNT